MKPQTDSEMLEQVYTIKIKVPFGCAVNSDIISYAICRELENSMPEESFLESTVRVSGGCPYITKPLFRYIIEKICAKINDLWVRIRYGEQANPAYW